MSIRDTSLIALEKIRLEPDEQAVFQILLEIGPAHDRRILEALNQKEQASLKPAKLKRKWEINSVTGRRNSLVSIYIVRDLGPHKGLWHGRNKTYHIWAVAGNERKPTGWIPVPKKDLPSPAPDPVQAKQNIERIKHQAEKPILQKLAASEAGRALVQYRYGERRKQTAKTRQMLLFA